MIDYTAIAQIVTDVVGSLGKDFSVSGRTVTGINRQIKDSEVDGSRIQRGDRSISFVDPVSIGDIVNDEGSWYIHHVEKKQPADTALVYIAYMRQ